MHTTPFWCLYSTCVWFSHTTNAWCLHTTNDCCQPSSSGCLGTAIFSACYQYATGDKTHVATTIENVACRCRHCSNATTAALFVRMSQPNTAIKPSWTIYACSVIGCKPFGHEPLVHGGVLEGGCILKVRTRQCCWQSVPQQQRQPSTQPIGKNDTSIPIACVGAILPRG